MKLGGWFFMVGSWLVILGLLCYCLYRVLVGKKDYQGQHSDSG